MTWREYFNLLGFAAFFAPARSALNRALRAEIRINELESLREKEKSGFLDREINRMGYRPIHTQPQTTVPPKLQPARSMASIMDKAAEEIEKTAKITDQKQELDSQDRATRIAQLHDRLPKVGQA